MARGWFSIMHTTTCQVVHRSFCCSSSEAPIVDAVQAGANIAGFLKVAEAMLAQGVY